MKSSFCFALWMLAVGSLAARAQAVAPGAAASPRVPAEYGKLPLSFEANRGQVDSRVRFLSRGQGYSLFLTDSGAVLSLTKREAGRSVNPTLRKSAKDGAPSLGTRDQGLGTRNQKLGPGDEELGTRDEGLGTRNQKLATGNQKLGTEDAGLGAGNQELGAGTDVVRMELAGALRGVRVTGDEQLPGIANYFIGNDPAK